MRVLVACEYSGAVSDAFRRRGHDSWSVDLTEPCEGAFPEHHIIGDARAVVARGGWDLLIAHPPCTFLTVAANGWLYHPDDKGLPVASRRPHPAYPNRLADREAAVGLFMDFARAAVPRIVIENPVGIMSSRWRSPDQVIQPHTFGADASKATCLWLIGDLPRLRPTAHIAGRVVELPVETDDATPFLPGLPAPTKRVRRWSNQTDGGDNALSPSPDRWKLRSTTYPGIAEAMALQRGGLPPARVRDPDPCLF